MARSGRSSSASPKAAFAILSTKMREGLSISTFWSWCEPSSRASASASTASPSELGSHQDQNVLIDGPSGRFVLKIANAAFGEAELDLQNRAMVHLGERLPLEVPRPCPALDGSEIVAVEREGVTYLLRLVTFIEGEPLIDALHLAPPVLFALGEVAGLVARCARGLRAPGRRPRDAVGSAPRRRRGRGARAARRGSAPPRARPRARGRRGRGDRAARTAAAHARSCTAT